MPVLLYSDALYDILEEKTEDYRREKTHGNQNSNFTL
jgi:hypothetical protein